MVDFALQSYVRLGNGIEARKLDKSLVTQCKLIYQLGVWDSLLAQNEN